MGKVREPARVKLIAGMLAATTQALEPARRELEARFGPVSDESVVAAFDHTRYYEQEMGSPLLRQFVAFGKLVGAEELPVIKHFTNELEGRLSGDGDKRVVNIDPGYLAPGKLVLASTKNHEHRLYLGSGIYGEVTLRFREGRFRPWEWTYPDYRAQSAVEFFERVYAAYLAQLRAGGHGGT